MSRGLMLAAEEARRLLQEHGLEGEAAKLSVESETSLAEVIGRMLEAQFTDEALIDHCKVRQAELKLRIERYEHRMDQRKDAMVNALAHAGLEESLDCGVATVWRTTPAPGVKITDATKLPADCLRTKTETRPDAKAIAAKLAAGESVPGAELANARPTISVRKVK